MKAKNLGHQQEVEMRSLEQKKQLEWIKQEAQYRRLLQLAKNVRDPEKVFGSKWKESFQQKPRVIVCIDEGAINDPTEPELGLAGSGVLLNDEQFEKVVAYCRHQGVSEVSYHAHCGAVALYCKEYELHHGLRPGSLKPEEESLKAASKLHQALGLRGKPVFISEKN